ncbi:MULTISPECIES: NUDIX hydrolase [Psychrilyobacter]|uniref:NUDIX domain-containing protein n=1 Tax=Psychrilyobacter piezotolerans TaxID=2293438 RepID=A0ABX9KJ26_9FUSO|nr:MULTISPECIES: NUDIX domain-containing protein [Psychrilyobacter]MCS5422823.1 NUDIX domain-containing protein [Psychrilyobacter sp. S5]NDI77184.1 NUDIX domain-containing protein [Psychrilyobacter piezotolerans]RDE64176.1 NUDIX domain-containing protein [Psychrilyobacter sp. S5]REI42268.1 NUDIX domain-containing protein [Psychrilyobacter piezotolerans]
MDCKLITADKRFRYRAAAIIIEDRDVLFAKNERDSYYYSVGGAVKIGESAEDAVKREVLEETGIAYEIERLAFIHENFFEGNGGTLKKGVKCHEVCFYFLMKSRGIKELKSDSSTADGIREFMHWLPIEKLENYEAHPSFFAKEIQNIGEYVKHIVTKE